MLLCFLMYSLSFPQLIQPPTGQCCGDGVCEGDEGTSCPGDCAVELETTWAGGNSQRGNAFKISAADEDIQVTSLTVNTNTAGGGNIKVWHKTGTYSGFLNNAGAWEYVGQFSVSGLGPGQQTELPNFPTPISVASGNEHSFYVSSSLDLAYTNGSGEGNVFASNSHLTFYEGVGISQDVSSSLQPFPLRFPSRHQTVLTIYAFFSQCISYLGRSKP